MADSCDDSSHCSDHSSSPGTFTSTTRTKTEGQKIQEQLFKEESQAVIRLRLFVLMLLMVFAMVVSISVFGVTYNNNVKQFEREYQERANTLLHSFAHDILHHVESLPISTKNGEWPFQLVPNFQQLMTRSRHNTGILSVTIAPVVKKEDFSEWESFVSMPENNGWIDEAYLYQEDRNINGFELQENIQKSRLTTDRTVDPMHYLDDTGLGVAIENTSPFYLPIFQCNPVLQTSHINKDMLKSWAQDNPSLPLEEIQRVVFEDQAALVGGFLTAPAGSAHHVDPKTALYATLESMAKEKDVEYPGDPLVHFYIPVFDVQTQNEKKVVAVMTALVSWRAYLENLLPKDDQNGIVIVLSNTCLGHNSSDSFTYEVRGSEAILVGFGDRHDATFDEFRQSGEFAGELLDDGTISGILFLDKCKYQLDVYPSDPFFQSFKTSTPIVITMCVVLAFVLVTFMFLFYDRLVEWRQTIVLKQATQTTALVSELFPKAVRDRLMLNADSADDKLEIKGKRLPTGVTDATTLQGSDKSGAHIADLFMNVTVCFMDIAGFTSWSSTREPSHVFILLQSIYGAFDEIAKRRKVFKVETIGDSYMAVTGLPEAMRRHATVMVRYAADCLARMHEVVRDLEGTLGPGTGSLSMRVGVHSGPVTAGVLMGSRCRYQLFGDTVNTASRMESTGVAGRIQVSSTTAEILEKDGKGHLLVPRDEEVCAKGKGHMRTFFIKVSIRNSPGSTISSTLFSSLDRPKDVAPKEMATCQNDRLVIWLVSMLAADIKELVSFRRACGETKEGTAALVYHTPDANIIPMDEVKEAIDMKLSNARTVSADGNGEDISINPQVAEDLKDFVDEIASKYRDNPFHNFEHCCHVAMSVRKIMSRIIPSRSSQSNLTVDIAADPLVSLAMTFSALIHDVDHIGVSNVQLGKEFPELAEKYRNQSIAEQNSVDVAWEILLADKYQRLRSYVFVTREEMMRFRQLVVNVVLATDIFNGQLNEARKKRWDRAFSRKVPEHSEGDQADGRLRATIFIEHIIQASDVSHTMQHWHIYTKWNEKLYREMHLAYKAGRMAKDPSTFWYQGEMAFFDNYVIPLAEKMKDCGVFGVSSDEYLNYALQNRNEWEQRGQGIVEKLKALTTVDE